MIVGSPAAMLYPGPMAITVVMAPATSSPMGRRKENRPFLRNWNTF
jgi:hypothetical protein